MNGNDRKQQKKSGGKGVAALVIVTLVSSLFSTFLNESSNGEDTGWVVIAVAILVGIVIMLFVVGQVKRAGARRAGQTNARPAQPPAAHVHRQSMPAARQYREPDPYCIVCENTGEDHFVRDRERRLAMVDDWLKNGLIDRNEYQVLKQRFERGI